MRATGDERKRFGTTLRHWREQAGLSTYDLAKQLKERGQDYSAQAISAWELGSYSPNRPTIVALEETLAAGGELLPLLGMTSDPALRDLVEDLAAKVESLSKTNRALTRRVEQMARDLAGRDR